MNTGPVSHMSEHPERPRSSAIIIPDGVDFKTRVERGEKICAPDLFAKKQPLEIEIGCGKGRFALQRAQENPGINIIAFDKLWKFLKRRKASADRQDLPNLVYFKAEAGLFLDKAVPDESVSISHLYFPDPWPKRKHHYRRTFDLAFLKTVWNKTKPGGFFEIATDFEDYYQVMMKVIGAQKDWKLIRETVNERFFAPSCLTNYEIKYQVEGRKLHYLELKKE
jgi:tRNA (guanine-N7-)-methyltransferase